MSHPNKEIEVKAGAFYRHLSGEVYRLMAYDEEASRVTMHRYNAPIARFNIIMFHQLFEPTGLTSFPGAGDALPYDFDLHFDLKTTAALKRTLDNMKSDYTEMVDMARKHNIRVPGHTHSE